MNKKKAKIVVVGNYFLTKEIQLQANQRLFNHMPRKIISLPAITTWYHISYVDSRRLNLL